MSGRRLPSLRAPWIAGLMLFLVLASAAGICLSRTGDSAQVPQSVLESRQESTKAAQEAISRSLDGGMGSLAEIAAVVDESMSRPDQALPVLLKGRTWKSLYVVDRASRVVVAQVGAPAQPAVLGDPAPGEAGMRVARADTGRQIVEYTPIGKAADAKYLLVGQFDPDRLGELLAAAGPEGAWLLDKSGSVIVGPDNRKPPLGVIDPGLEPGEASSGSRAQHTAGQEEVVAWAAMGGKPSSTALGWTVASEQSTTEAAALTDASRRRAVTVGAGLAGLTVIVFAALHLLLLRPIRLLSRVAESSRRTVPKTPKHGEAGRIAMVLTHARHSGRHRPLALLTWSSGAALLLGAAATVAIVPPSWPVDAIPASVAAEQQSRSSLAAHQLQTLLDSGVSDLTAVATGVRLSKDTETPAKLLSQLMSTRDRYRGVGYLAPNGELRAKSGEDVDASAIKAADEPALAVDARHGGSPRVFVSAPVTGENAGRLIAEFAPSALSGPLSLAGPGNTWFLDADRKVIATTAASGLSSRPDLEQAARDAAGGPGHALRDVDGGRHLVSWAPVTTTQLSGLTVVTDRPETSPAPADPNEKHALLLLGALIAVLTIVIFAWLYAVVVRPLSALAKVAGRLGRGDIGAPVVVRGYDQLGLVARGLERVRRDLIRSIATTPPSARRSTTRPRPATGTHSRAAAAPPPPSSRRTSGSPAPTTTRRPRRVS